MNSITMAAALYFLGVALFFVYEMWLVDGHSPMETIREVNNTPISDGALYVGMTVVMILLSFAWPICSAYNLYRALSYKEYKKGT